MVWWVPLAAAAVSAAGNYLGGQSTNSANSQMVDRQQDFQERMSSTAHQREVGDLRAAGLNPILSTRLGGASSPTGSIATMVNSIGNATDRGVSTALATQLQSEQIEKIRADTEAAHASAQKDRTQASLNNANEHNVTADTANKVGINEYLSPRQKAELENIVSQRDLRRAELPGMHSRSRILGHEEHSAKALATEADLKEYFRRTDLGEILYKIGLAGKDVEPIAGSVSRLSLGSLLNRLFDDEDGPQRPGPRRGRR